MFVTKNDINTHLKNFYNNKSGINFMVFIALYYALAIAVLGLHFTGHLERWNMDWLVFVFALTVFPAVLYL